ncbi:MAG: hypothetical protein ACRDRD_10830, partial [Pseudonocardiaceae bacterium]
MSTGCGQIFGHGRAPDGYLFPQGMAMRGACGFGDGAGVGGAFGGEGNGTLVFSPIGVSQDVRRGPNKGSG